MNKNTYRGYSLRALYVQYPGVSISANGEVIDEVESYEVARATIDGWLDAR